MIDLAMILKVESIPPESIDDDPCVITTKNITWLHRQICSFHHFALEHFGRGLVEGQCFQSGPCAVIASSLRIGLEIVDSISSEAVSVRMARNYRGMYVIIEIPSQDENDVSGSLNDPFGVVESSGGNDARWQYKSGRIDQSCTICCIQRQGDLKEDRLGCEFALCIEGP